MTGDPPGEAPPSFFCGSDIGRILSRAGLSIGATDMAWILLIAHVLGLVTSIHALMTVRTSQGSIAWIVSLNTLPLAAFPAFGVLGPSRFQGYVIGRRARPLETDPAAREIVRRLEPLVPEFLRSPA